MYIVTGGFGFIGSNIVKRLNQRGISDILVVDDLEDGHKFVNLIGCDFLDYQDKDDFISDINSGKYKDKNITAIFHEGACSATTEWDGKYIMKNNYEYSRDLLNFAIKKQIPFLYASSAATYGLRESDFIEDIKYEKPVNVYGFSKFQFDQYVRNILPNAKSQIVGFKYFNVYGPHEQHKGNMASVAFHHYNQMETTGSIKLFGDYLDYKAGEQMRDFVYIDDVIDVNFWALDNRNVSGIFNLGTQNPEPFNNIAKSCISWFSKNKNINGKLEYENFPDSLKGHYQSYTKADLTKLKKAGFVHKFKTVDEGVNLYYNWLDTK